MSTEAKRRRPATGGSIGGRAAALAALFLLTFAGPGWAQSKPPMEGDPPRLLPGQVGVAALKDVRDGRWLVGATPGARSDEIASRFGARRLGRDSGIFALGSNRARPFVAALRAAGRYQFSEPNSIARRSAFPTDPLSGSQWGLGAIGVLGLDPPAVGPNSPLIGILEGGLDVTHPDTQGIGLSGTNSTDPEAILHGTLVASVAAAPANGQGISGVWPGARATVFAFGSDCASVVAGIYESLKAGSKVLNMSYGFADGGCFSHYVATQQAFGNGTALVAAAGNEFLEGNPSDSRPAADPHVITVAGLNPDLTSAGFSNENNAIDLAGPAVEVLGALPGGWASASGTSFASPMVAAGAAWTAALKPGLHITQLTDLVRTSTRDLGPSGWDPRFGYGVFDMPTALTRGAPPIDPLEPNDNVSWINGRFFGRPDPPVWKGRRAGVRFGARVDRLEDPFDVYRIKVPARSTVSIRVRPTSGNPVLEAYNGFVKTILSNRGRIAVSSRPGGATERVVFFNPFRSAKPAFVSIWSKTLSAGYTLKIRRGR